jgi:hypothetical protein
VSISAYVLIGNSAIAGANIHRVRAIPDVLVKIKGRELTSHG